jgi:spore germination protein YaaH
MRQLLAAAAALALVGGVAQAAPASPTADRRAAPLASTGYILAGGSDALVAREAHGLATLGVDGVTLSRRGDAVGGIDGRLAATAHANGLRAELLLSNYSDRLGDFDPRAAARLLRDPAHRQLVAGQLVSLVASQGWDGIQVDLESLGREDADGLLALIGLLQSSMAPEKTVSIAVMASDQASEYVARGYLLPELGQAVDTLALMTYDQHGPWSGPGPIAALPWVRRELGYFLTRLPRAKVDLGAAAYGYRWGGGAPELSVPQARSLAGTRARWDATDGEWHASLPGGRTLWWDDARSVELRRRLAVGQHLHGLAVWELGSSGLLR